MKVIDRIAIVVFLVALSLIAWATVHAEDGRSWKVPVIQAGLTAEEKIGLLDFQCDIEIKRALLMQRVAVAGGANLSPAWANEMLRQIYVRYYALKAAVRSGNGGAKR